MREAFLSSVEVLAQPLRGLRVLLYGFSGKGFPGGDGVLEANQLLPQVGVQTVYTHAKEPELGDKLRGRYDLAIVTNTRIRELMAAPMELWCCAETTILWFWDLRPGSVGAPLNGRVDRVFLSFNGPWMAPGGVLYEPAQWEAALECPVGYCPQASPTRTPERDGSDSPRILFVGDLANRTYHSGRRELTQALGAEVLNARPRDQRLAIEARLPRAYASSRYCLSTSPAAPGYTSVRTYSILACGGLLLLHRFPGCERLIEDGTHAVIFDSAEDAKARLLELDQDVDLRLRIAEAGRALQATRHTVTHRILSICREVTGVSEGFYGWL